MTRRFTDFVRAESLLAVTLALSVGCLTKDVEIEATVTWGPDSIGCFVEPLDTLVIDLFEYTGPTERPTISSSPCTRCATGADGASCRHLGRVCRCGPIESMADVADVFVGARFPNVDPGAVCIRVGVLATGTSEVGECPASAVCPEGAMEGQIPVCLISQLGLVSEDKTRIQVNQVSCAPLDPVVPSCRGRACECPLRAVIACADREPDCVPECLPEISDGCFSGSAGCQLARSGAVTTSECVDIGRF